MDPKKKQPKKTKDDPLARLVEQAKKDPKFFHDLVFDPEKVLSKVNYLSRKSKATLIAINPENLIQSLVGIRLNWCGDPTCGDDSCINTCGAHSCDSTCTSSCGGTCKWSCGDTTSVFLEPGDLATGIGSIRRNG